MHRSLFDRIFQPERTMRVAVLFEHSEITYEQLRALTIETAEKLNALGIEPGDRVAMLLNDSPEFIASFVSIISLGAIAVPINMALPRSDWLVILKDCGARAGIVEANALSSLFHESTPLPELKEILIIPREGYSSVPSFKEVKTLDFARAERAPLERLPIPER